MDAFNKMSMLMDQARIDYDKHYTTENMEAGSRLYKKLNELTRLSKLARKDLKVSRDKITNKRNSLKAKYQ